MAAASPSSMGLTASDTNSIILKGSTGFHKKLVANFSTCKVGRACEAESKPRLGNPS